MSSKGGNQTVAEFENEALIEFNKKLKESLDREAKMHRHFQWRGNRIPPFGIEPMPSERDRLEKPMTAEERMMRKQWLDDQILAPNEPIYIPELYPRNPIRRFLGKPWDTVFNALKPVIGESMAFKGRYFVPRYVMLFVFAYGMYYYGKYNPAVWTSRCGVYVYSSRPPVYEGEEKLPEKEYDDFYDQGFKHRKAPRDGKTSMV